MTTTLRRLVQTLLRWARALALRGALVVASVALTVLAFEGLARQLIPEWTPPAGDRKFWGFDQELGWHHRPGQRGHHEHRDFRVAVRINEDGLRDRDYARARTPGHPRMLLLGDSFGWGHGVEQHEMVSELLEARRPPWEIINASVSGYGTDQQLLWFLREGVAYQPDVVLLLFHPNDFLDNHRWSRYGYRKPLFELEGDSPRAHPAAGLSLTRVPVTRRNWDDRVDRWLYLHSYLYPRLFELPDLVSEAVLALRPKPEPVPRATASLAPVPTAPARPRDRSLDDEHLEITRRILLRLEREVSDTGARLVAVSVRMVPHLREVLEDFMAEAGVPYLALDEAFAAESRTALHFPHDPHWNPAGHRVAADAIEGFLLELGIFEGPGRKAVLAGNEGDLPAVP